MNKINRQELADLLGTKYGYPQKNAGRVAEQLLALETNLLRDFHAWLLNGGLPSTEFYGYTVTRLMEEHGMNAIAAFLTLDWLLREPERARASLERGHDRVVRRR